MAQEEAEMTSADQSRILVLDANIMLRAVLGTRVRSLIERYAEEVPLSTCEMISGISMNQHLPSTAPRVNQQ
jgi:hypothetical protein